MHSYADVIFGRLLLHEGAVSLEGLWTALADLVQAGRSGVSLSLPEALARGPLASGAGAQAIARTNRNLAVVERVETERTLARLLHDDGLLPESRIRQLYAEGRQAAFQEGLADRLLREGLLSPAQVSSLRERTAALLTQARDGRRELLTRLLESLGPRYTALEGERIRRVFALAQAPTPAVQAELDEPETPPHALVQVNLPEPAPEDCPIYGYEIIEELGKGSMGVVYKARHIITKRITALKILPLRLANKTHYLERFKREAMALMRIRHENVVEGLDFGGSEQYYYLALEFIEGETLDDILRRAGKLPERQALDIVRQVARGLEVAASHGLVHRDIKPENVMLTTDGVAKICDFGIVHIDDLSESHVTMAGTTVGTPFYIAPEQARGEEGLDIRSDIYSLGITLYHLTTGQVPFTGKSQGAILVRHILEDVPDPRLVAPDLSDGLAAVVRRMTEKKPADRYPDAQALIADLDALLA